MSIEYLSVRDVVLYHDLLMATQGKQPAVQIAPEKLASAVARPASRAFDTEAFPTLSEKAAALLQGIITAHPFLDGNKRAGLGAMLLFLALNGVDTAGDQDALYDLTVGVARSEIDDLQAIAARVREIFALP